MSSLDHILDELEGDFGLDPQTFVESDLDLDNLMANLESDIRNAKSQPKKPNPQTQRQTQQFHSDVEELVSLVEDLNAENHTISKEPMSGNDLDQLMNELGGVRISQGGFDSTLDALMNDLMGSEDVTKPAGPAGPAKAPVKGWPPVKGKSSAMPAPAPAATQPAAPAKKENPAAPKATPPAAARTASSASSAATRKEPSAPTPNLDDEFDDLLSDLAGVPIKALGAATPAPQNPLPAGRETSSKAAPSNTKTAIDDFQFESLLNDLGAPPPARQPLKTPQPSQPAQPAQPGPSSTNNKPAAGRTMSNTSGGIKKPTQVPQQQAVPEMDELEVLMNQLTNDGTGGGGGGGAPQQKAQPPKQTQMVPPQAQPVKAQAQHNPTPDLDDLMAELMPSNKPPLQTQQSRNQMPQRNEVEVDPLESLMDQLSGPSHNPPAYNNSNPNMQPNNSYNNNYNKPTPTTYNDPRPINNNFNKPTPTNYNDQRPSSAPRGPNVPSTNDLEDMLNSLAVDNNYSNNPPKNNFNNNQKPNQYNNNFSNDPRATLYGAQPVDFTNPPQSINNRNTMMDPRMSGAFDPRAGYGGFSNDPRATVSLGNFGAFPNDPRASMGPGYDPRAMGGPGYDPRASMGPGYDPRMMGGPNPRATAQDLNVIMEGLNNPAMSSNMGGSMQRRPEQKLPKGVCAGCRKYITGPQRVQALGKDYHPEHFQCSTCGRPIGNGSFYENEGQPQCEMCYQSVFCQKCGKCNRPITSTCTTAIGQSWHPECFTCTRCNVPFGNSTFFVHFSRPYCSVCIAGVR